MNVLFDDFESMLLQKLSLNPAFKNKIEFITCFYQHLMEYFYVLPQNFVNQISQFLSHV